MAIARTQLQVQLHKLQLQLEGRIDDERQFKTVKRSQGLLVTF